MHPADTTLNAYIDHELAADEAAAVAEHLDRCDACRRLTEDLEGLVRAAARLGALDPPEQVWTRLARQRDLQRPAARRPRIGASWLATAAILVLATAAGVQLAGWRFRHDVTYVSTTPDAFAPEWRETEATYEHAIAGLQQDATSIETALGPELGAEWHRNLTVLNTAIADSRAAVARSPDDAVARQSLFDGLSTKAAILQTATEIVSPQRSNQRGN